MKTLLILFLFAIPMIFFSWVLPRRYVLVSQILITAAFIGYLSPVSLAILTFITFANYYLLHSSGLASSVKIAVSIVFLVLLISSAKILFSISHNWAIPIGMSYYIFRNIHYTIEYYKNAIKADGVLYYIAYNFFLPVILIGPINRYQDFIKDWHRRRFNNEYFSLGLQHVLYGLSKIIILGNYCFTSRSKLFIAAISSEQVWLKTYLEVLRFTFNAYFQFSGYSDVAIGLSIMMGYKIMENFNYPFLATNMREFWGRYHMSLSVFCKDYIYTPIASYYRKPVIGIIATMLIIGLWHEVSLRYLLWGVVQACGIYMATLIKPRRTSFLMKNLSRLSVAHYFAFSCVIVSQDTLAGALHIYKTLFFIG